MSSLLVTTYSRNSCTWTFCEGLRCHLHVVLHQKNVKYIGAVRLRRLSLFLGEVQKIDGCEEGPDAPGKSLTEGFQAQGPTMVVGPDQKYIVRLWPLVLGEMVETFRRRSTGDAPVKVVSMHVICKLEKHPSNPGLEYVVRGSASGYPNGWTNWGRQDWCTAIYRRRMPTW